MIRILALPGSLREASFSRRLARLAAQLAPDGVQVDVYDHLGEVEPFNEDLEGGDRLPPGAARLAGDVRGADALLITTPEYNGSVPGQLKNALDWLSRPEDGTGRLQASPLYGVPVAAASISTGQFGALWARDELVKVLRTQGARPIFEPSVTIPNADAAFHDDGTLTSASAQERLAALLQQVLEQVSLLRAAREAATS